MDVLDEEVKEFQLKLEAILEVRRNTQGVFIAR